MKFARIWIRPSLLQRLLLNLIIGLIVPAFIFVQSRSSLLTTAAAALSLAGALVLTAMEPGYHMWNPSTRAGRLVRSAIDMCYSIREGRLHTALRWALAVLFLSICGFVLVGLAWAMVE